MLYLFIKLFSVSAYDVDSGWNGVLVFTITDDDNGPFAINPFSKSTFSIVICSIYVQAYVSNYDTTLYITTVHVLRKPNKSFSLQVVF